MVLGDIDNTVNPRDPVIDIVPVTKKRKNIPAGYIHSDYIDEKVYYNILKLFVDHQKLFPVLYNVAVGSLHLISQLRLTLNRSSSRQDTFPILPIPGGNQNL